MAAEFPDLRISIGGQLVALPFPVKSGKGQPIAAPDFDALPLSKQEAIKTSIMGTPIHAPTTLGGMDLPNEPLVSVTLAKHIVRTRIAGSPDRGTVKEDMGRDDFAVTLTGWLINEDEEAYPDALVQELQELARKQEVLEIVNPILSLYSITKVVVLSYSAPPLAGHLGVQPYTLTMVSDEPFDLVLKNEDEF